MRRDCLLASGRVEGLRACSCDEEEGGHHSFSDHQPTPTGTNLTGDHSFHLVQEALNPGLCSTLWSCLELKSAELHTEGTSGCALALGILGVAVEQGRKGAGRWVHASFLIQRLKPNLEGGLLNRKGTSPSSKPQEL